MKRNPAVAASLLVVAATIFVATMRETTETPSPTGHKSQLPATATAASANRPEAAGTAKIPRLPSGRDARHMPLASDLLDHAVEGETFRLSLPDGREAQGPVQAVQRDARGILTVQGKLSAPESGRYFFHRQTIEGVAGELVGDIMFDRSEVGWKVLPAGPGGSPLLVEAPLDDIVCRNYAAPTREGPEAAPEAHPTDIPIPSYQAIIPLQSLPGATGVIYLDFDGEEGPFLGWDGDFDAAPSGASNDFVYQTWKRVAEDFLPFNLNITTDRQVFEAAPHGSRQHVIITPTTTAVGPGWGGYARGNSFNWSADIVCWVFITWGSACAEAISHETGHTLNLGHDGRTSPGETYYAGQGSGSTGWAPIMGNSYYRNLTQWSKGDYLNADNTQDDLAQIANNNNNVDYRADDAGHALATARHLEISSGGLIAGEGIIEQRGDVDAFRFLTTGGQAALNLQPATSGPNLDIAAELVDASTGTVLASSNPDLALTASFDLNLPAGEYLIKIRGTGRGDPAIDGYSDYASLGTYLISGSVAGGVEPDRFTLAENTASGTVVGTVSSRTNHHGATLAWSITGGNPGGAFAIDPATGVLTVAAASPLDFEALSTRWDDPADLELFVTIADSLNPALNETLRVVVSLTNVNEAPTVANASLTLLERTRTGTTLLKLVADDPDPFQFPVFSITAGNDHGWFALDPGTGELRIASGIEVNANTQMELTVQVTDQGTPALTASATVNLAIVGIASGYEPGGVKAAFFDGIPGKLLSDLTSNPRFPDSPTREVLLPDFDNPGHGDNYGSVIRGYVIPPATGSYRFWIASDDTSELRLSTTASPSNAATIASVSGWANPYAWPDSSPQQSVPVNLVAGQAYYLEARHKEADGGDHLSVAWSGPGIPKQLLRGIYLAPYDYNYAPTVANRTFYLQEGAFAGQRLGTLPVTDLNRDDRYQHTITAGNSAGIFAIDPATGVIRVAAPHALNAAAQPVHTLTVQIVDDGHAAFTATGTLTVHVRPAGTFPPNALIQQVWTGIPGSDLSSLTNHAGYPNRPDYSRTITNFDTGASAGDQYGSRIRALVTPPVSGSYTFHLSSDDDARLRFANGATPAWSTQIASVTGYSSKGEWTKFPTQTSAPVNLVAGQSYYLETLHKDNWGGDHVQVGWTGPGIATVTVIPSSALQPYDANRAPSFSGAPVAVSLAEGSPAGTLVASVAATDPDGEMPVHAITASTAPGAFAIDPDSGALTVANSAVMFPGLHSVTVTAQDSGLGGPYPFQTATKNIEITVTGSPQPPVFTIDPPVMAATVGVALQGSLAATDSNAGDVLTFTKVNGPGWLTVLADGTFSGTPGSGDAGSNVFTVRVADSSGAFDETTLVIGVTADGPPLPWEEGSIGSGPPGHSTSDQETITLTGSGTLVGRNDGLHFVWQPLSGDGTITARLDAMSAAAPDALAGVMIRDTLATNSRHVLMGLTGSGGYRWIRRTGFNGNTSTSRSGSAILPGAWFRLVRSGDTITAFKSTDGVAWVTVGSLSAALPATCYFGLAVTSGSPEQENTATFSHLMVSP